MRIAAVLTAVAFAAGAAPALAQQPAGTIAYSVDAAPGSLSTLTFGATPAPLVTGQAGNPAWSPDGARLAFAAPGPSGRSQLVRTIAATGGPGWRTRGSSGSRCPRGWS